jgi:putative transposon-encoded protein
MAKLIETADFPVIVELKLSTKWKWEKYACMTNAWITYNKENQENLDLNCGSSSYSDTVAEMKLNMYRVLNSNLLNILAWAKTVVIPAWDYAVSEKYEVLSDKIIQLPYQSNDNNWVTAVVVKSNDGATTYTVDTDYSVVTTDNKTTITILAGAIKKGDIILVEWSVKLNETKKVVTKLGTSADQKIDVRFIGSKEVAGTDYNFSLEAKEWNNTSSYNIEFLNKIKWGLPKGTEVTFKFDTNETIMLDEISPAEAAL